MNNIINQIVEVLDRYTHEDFINVDFVVFKSDFQEVATEIAALHPLTKIIEELERLRDEAEQMQRRYIANNHHRAESYATGRIAAIEEILSLLTQENDGWISVEDYYYQIDFGNHLRCNIKVTENRIQVEYAVNGWGDNVPLSEIVVVGNQPIPSPPKRK